MNTLQSTMDHAHALSKWHTQVSFAVVRDNNVKFNVTTVGESLSPEDVIYVYRDGIRTTLVQREVPEAKHKSLCLKN